MFPLLVFWIDNFHTFTSHAFFYRRLRRHFHRLRNLNFLDYLVIRNEIIKTCLIYSDESWKYLILFLMKKNELQFLRRKIIKKCAQIETCIIFTRNCVMQWHWKTFRLFLNKTFWILFLLIKVNNKCARRHWTHYFLSRIIERILRISFVFLQCLWQNIKNKNILERINCRTRQIR